MRRLRSYIDPFLIALLSTVAFASVLPARGQGAVAADFVANAAVALLFFLHGAKLSPDAALAGLRHWRLHGLVFLSTFALFPAIGLTAHALAPQLLPAPLWAGVLLVTILPSTVQASIALTSVAGGNVPAAICSASASNLIGLALTPLLAGLLLANGGVSFSAHTVLGIVLQMLAPFIAGQVLRPWIGAFVRRNARMLKFVDYGSILLIVYSAFSHGVVNDIWHQVGVEQIVRVMLMDLALLAVVMSLLTVISRRFGFSRPDEITIVFCGSKKSLATGLPIANVLFAGHVGLAILPVMLFHQIQLMVCATLARRYAANQHAAEIDAQPATATS
ncbi:MAG: bile acid:sodium symporter [Proteobacteria bacterium]|nr:bile acid:sodium symporter [Pseudomonadota bacterium]